MRVLSIVLVWLTAAAIALTLWNFGMVQHYWYANDQGLGYDLVKWQGDTLDNAFVYPKGYRFRYSTFRFEKNAETRAILIITVLACACAGTILLIVRLPKKAKTQT
jgi:hypothetical protein